MATTRQDALTSGGMTVPAISNATGRPRAKTSRRPLIILVCNGKGGSGKTTIVLGLAGIAAGSGLEVIVVDADPQQSAFMLTHALKQPPRYTVVVPENNPEDLRYLRDAQADIIIVDTPGSLAEGGVLGEALKYADVIVIPSDMSPLSSAPTVQTVDFLVCRGATPNMLLNMVQGRKQEAEARETFGVYEVRADTGDRKSAVLQVGVYVLQYMVRKYVAHGRAMGDGVPITEWQGLNAAAAQADLLAVFHEIIRASPALQAIVGGWK
jgi:chromosome partitioning protein